MTSYISSQMLDVAYWLGERGLSLGVTGLAEHRFKKRPTAFPRLQVRTNCDL